MIGFDIGGTKCAVCIGEPQEDRFIISDKRSFATKDARDPYEMIEWLCSAAEEMTDDLSRVGISCGGPLDTARGLILSPPNLPGWDEIPIVELVEKRLGCRAALRNDADACALAEWRYGAGRGSDSMVFLTFGTGFGAGVILNRALWQGATGRAGEIGHVRLAKRGPVGYYKAGSVEGFCSGGGIAKLASKAVKRALVEGIKLPYCASERALDGINAKVIADYARQGETVARGVYDTVATRLGETLAIIFDILDPDVVVIGSIFERCEDLLRPGMEKVLFREALRGEDCCVVPAVLGDSIGDIAALTVAQEV